MESGQQEKRIEEVELLFDREAPEVLSGRRVAQQSFVPGVGGNEPPVGEVDERSEAVLRYAHSLRDVPRELCERCRQEQGDERSRHQAAQAADPESGEIDATRASLFFNDGPRDQETREREEGRDTEEAALHPAESGVEEQNGEDRHAAKAL